MANYFMLQTRKEIYVYMCVYIYLHLIPHKILLNKMGLDKNESLQEQALEQ